jgi:peptidoglycan/LPS O-acetylase OafA/YrhL
LTASKRLPGVDGLRAVAALWVVLFHIAAFSTAQFPQIPGLELFLTSGSTGVSLFLLLSGFCLYLPFAGGRASRFRVGEFFRRRCYRLMPAYYVSLVLALGLAVLSATWLNISELTAGDAVRQLVTHVFLVHTLFPDTFYSLNGAFWSLGLEWQLYLALPLLIWITRRVGLTYAVGLAIACNVVYRVGLSYLIKTGAIDGQSLLAGSVLPNQLPGRWAEFALGMVAAELYTRGHLTRWRYLVPGAWAAMVALVPLCLLASKVFDLSHVAYGALFFALLCLVIGRDNAVARVLAWRPLVVLGTVSYSLYLVHQPIIQLLSVWLRQTRPDLEPTTVFVVLLLLVPVIVVVAWGLFVTVERRTLTHGQGLTFPHVGQVVEALMSVKPTSKPDAAQPSLNATLTAD